VTSQRAIRFIERAISQAGGVWADIGCGDGTFTLALAELLGPTSRIYAVDNDPRAIARLTQRAFGRTNVIPVLADLTQPLVLPGYDGMLDGIFLANALHFVQEPQSILERLTTRLRPGGRAVFIEYDRRNASRWVPYPVPPTRLEKLALAAGLTAPAITATHPSVFSGVLYVAVATRSVGTLVSMIMSHRMIGTSPK
jgi:ubiquinone/menaquinone biosynthesis C-methylase UbiE